MIAGHRVSTFKFFRSESNFLLLFFYRNIRIPRQKRFKQKMYSEARIEISTQPDSKRFRYESEGIGRGGQLEGVKTTRQGRTHPSIKIVNYTGDVSVVVSCVTTEQPYKPHPHQLVGQNCRNGVCYIASFSTDSREPSILSFPELRIQCCEKKKFAERLNEREQVLSEYIPVAGQFEHMVNDIKRDLHSVRLCFQVIIRPDPENPNQVVQLEPKYTQPIINKKSGTDLNIHNISDTCSPVSGGKKIMIFCNKISKKDIRIRFFAEDAAKREIWVGWGKFQRHDVHRDVAIAFTTPEYGPKIIDRSTNFFIELVRPSDNARSERIRFEFIADVTDIDVMLNRQRRKFGESEKLFKVVETHFESVGCQEHLATLSHLNFNGNVQEQQNQRIGQRSIENRDDPTVGHQSQEHLATCTQHDLNIDELLRLQLDQETLAYLTSTSNVQEQQPLQHNEYLFNEYPADNASYNTTEVYQPKRQNRTEEPRISFYNHSYSSLEDYSANYANWNELHHNIAGPSQTRATNVHNIESLSHIF